MGFKNFVFDLSGRIKVFEYSQTYFTRIFMSYDDSRVIIVLMKLQNILYNVYSIMITV